MMQPHTLEGPSSVRRIAVVAYHSSPLIEPGTGDAGGMTVYVRALAEHLAHRGLMTDIYTRASSDLPRICEIAPGVRVVSIEAGPRRPIDKGQQPAFIDQFVAGVRAFATTQRLRYDVLHSHYWQSGLAARKLSFAWGAPLIHSQHSLGRVKNRFLAPGEAPEPRERLDGEDEVIRAADVLVASTDEEWQELSCMYAAPHDRLKTLHPGVDHERFAPGEAAEARAALGIPLGRAVLLCVGRIQRLKGLDLAIRSLAELVPALERDVELVIAGGPSGTSGRAEMPRLEDLAHDLGVADRVRFVGPQPHARLPVFYRAADALVVCSYSESFGLAPLEAHACGIPVVATAVGGLSHIVSDGASGFLVSSREPTVFASRLKVLLSDDDLAAAFRAESHKRSLGFSWDRSADAFMELYECVVREESPEVCTC